MDQAAFIEFVGKLEEPALEEVSEAFNVFDMHGHGFISLPELTHIMKALGEGLTDPELEGMTRAAAADGDGQVNIRHMVDVLMESF